MVLGMPFQLRAPSSRCFSFAAPFFFFFRAGVGDAEVDRGFQKWMDEC